LANRPYSTDPSNHSGTYLDRLYEELGNEVMEAQP
jgi:hypothetical protein